MTRQYSYDERSERDAQHSDRQDDNRRNTDREYGRPRFSAPTATKSDTKNFQATRPTTPSLTPTSNGPQDNRYGYQRRSDLESYNSDYDDGSDQRYFGTRTEQADQRYSGQEDYGGWLDRGERNQPRNPEKYSSGNWWQSDQSNREGFRNGAEQRYERERMGRNSPSRTNYGSSRYGDDYDRSDYSGRDASENHSGSYRESSYGDDRVLSNNWDRTRGSGDWYAGQDKQRGPNYSQYGRNNYNENNYGREFGSQSHQGKGPKGYERSDERLREIVCERLTDAPHIDATNIQVSVSSGEVTLTGTVDDRSAKHAAEDLIAGAGGVKEVHNQLKVKNSWSTEDNELRDRNSGTQPDNRFGTHPMAKQDQIGGQQTNLQMGSQQAGYQSKGSGHSDSQLGDSANLNAGDNKAKKS